MARLRHYLAAVRDIIGFIRREKCISFFVLHREQQGRVPSACIARLASTHSSSQRVERERERRRDRIAAASEETTPLIICMSRLVTGRVMATTGTFRSPRKNTEITIDESESEVSRRLRSFRFIREKSSFYQFPSIHPGSRRRVKERSSSSSHVHQQPRGRQQPFVA